MTGFGIICEFNPLHNGHKRIIDEAKQRGAEYVVCLMSGNAVQRGELAVLDKYTRAEAAIKAGADLVLELPYPYSAAGAEYFATAGVEILSRLCSSIIFGSECGDIEYLTSAARIAHSGTFRSEYKERLQSGEGAAGAYFSMLAQRGFDNVSSNDLLGIEYIRAALKKGCDFDFHTVKREGSAYGDIALNENLCPSATAIRRAWQSGDVDTRKYIPDTVYEVFEKAVKHGELVDTNRLSKAILMYLRLSSPDDFENIAEADGGVANRICSLAHEANSLDELFEKMKTKRYTDAKLRRALLFCLTGVTREMLIAAPEYTLLLGANAKGREVLAGVRRTGRLNIVTKPADAPTDSWQFAVGQRLEAIFTLAGEEPAKTGDSYRKKAFIL